MIGRPPRSTLLPYTALYRSLEARRGGIGADLDDRIEHQDGPGAVVAGGGGELPNRADRYAHRRDRPRDVPAHGDRKSTRLNSSHVRISYAVFCLDIKKSTSL